MKNIYTKRRSLKEGYGAGYTVASNHYENIKINKLELGEPDEKGNYIIEGANLDITADAHITVDHPEEFGQVYESPIVITRLLVNDQGMSKEDLEEFIVTELNYFKTRSIQGGGWSHVEFTGNVCSKESEIDCDVYAITEATIQMTNNDHIKFLDDMLKGDLHYTDYIIDTEDGELEPESDMNQAIEKAKEINAISVTAIEYAKTDYDGDYEELSTYSVWPEVNTLEFESAKRSYKRIVEEKHFPSYNELYDELATKIELELGINVEGHEDAANWIEGAVDYMLQSIEYGAYKGEAFDVVEEWWKDTASNYPEMINELKEMFPENIKENANGKDSYAIQSRNSNRLYSAIKDSELPTIFKNKLDAEQYIMKHNLEKEYFVVHLDESKNKDNSYAFVFECNNSTGKRKIIKQVIVNAKTIEEATKIAETEVNDRYVEEIENANGKYVLHEGRLTGKRVCEAIEYPYSETVVNISEEYEHYDNMYNMLSAEKEHLKFLRRAIEANTKTNRSQSEQQLIFKIREMLDWLDDSVLRWEGPLQRLINQLDIVIDDKTTQPAEESNSSAVANDLVVPEMESFNAFVKQEGLENVGNNEVIQKEGVWYGKVGGQEEFDYVLSEGVWKIQA